LPVPGLAGATLYERARVDDSRAGGDPPDEVLGGYRDRANQSQIDGEPRETPSARV